MYICPLCVCQKYGWGREFGVLGADDERELVSIALLFVLFVRLSWVPPPGVLSVEGAVFAARVTVCFPSAFQLALEVNVNLYWASMRGCRSPDSLSPFHTGCRNTVQQRVLTSTLLSRKLLP
eukprot:RCo002642